jgi:hypothetical protein
MNQIGAAMAIPLSAYVALALAAATFAVWVPIIVRGM